MKREASEKMPCPRGEKSCLEAEGGGGEGRGQPAPDQGSEAEAYPRTWRKTPPKPALLYSAGKPLPPPFCPTLSVPSQRTSRRSQPYLHFQQRFCALTEGTPPDSGQTSLSLVSRRGGGTGASRVLNHRPPHARHWTGPSLFTSHDNLDTSLHVLIRSVRH